jgi:GntR family transcriptional regulator
MISQAKEPSSEILACKLIQANEHQASKLQLSPGDELVFLSRLRKVDGVPIVVETALIPHELCPGLLGYMDEVTSLYTLFESVYDIQVKSAEVSWNAALANDTERNLLRLPDPSAVLHLEQLSLLEDGRPIELTYGTYHGSISSYQATVLRSKLGVVSGEERSVNETNFGGVKIKESLKV